MVVVALVLLLWRLYFGVSGAYLSPWPQYISWLVLLPPGRRRPRRESSYFAPAALSGSGSVDIRFFGGGVVYAYVLEPVAIVFSYCWQCCLRGRRPFRRQFQPGAQAGKDEEK
jgi:hypothetical protein